MKQFKRVTALSLLLAMVLGLFGGIPFVTTSAANSEPFTDVDGKPVINLLEDKNWSFDNGVTIPGWSVMEGVAQSDEHLYNDGGLWSMLLADSSSSAAVWSISDKNTINAGTKYEISAQVWGGIGKMTVTFYDKKGVELPDLTIELATEKAASEWQTLAHTFTADSKAASLSVKLSTTEAAAEKVFCVIPPAMVLN